MSLDEQLRDALRDDAGMPERASAPWDDVRARGRRMRRNRRLGRGATAFATSAALIVAGLLLTRSSDGSGSIAVTPSTGDQVVAALSDGTVVLIDPSDGRVIDTIYEATRGDDATWTTGISAAPNGTVFIGTGASARPSCDPAEDPESIVQVRPTTANASGRAPADVVESIPGSAPLVSPDGRYLAFRSRSTDDPCGPAGSLTVRDLHTGDEHGLQDVDPNVSLQPLAWSPDSRRLLFGSGPGRMVEVAVSPEGLGAAKDLPDLFGNGFAYRADGSLLTIVPGTGAAALDPATGAVIETLSPVSGYLMGADASATSLLVASPLGDSQDGWTLSSLRAGSPTPTPLADHVLDAAWVSRAEQTPTPTTATSTSTSVAPVPGTAAVAGPMPETIVALDSAQHVVELASDDGRVLREIDPRSRRGAWGIALDRARAVAYVGQSAHTSSCTESTVEIALDTGTSRELVRGASPRLSPDGSRLAYLAQCLPDPETVVVHDLATGEEQRWTMPPSSDDSAYHPIRITGWDAGGTHVMVQVQHEPEVEWWLVDTTAANGLAAREVAATTDNALRGPVELAPLGLTSRWAGVFYESGLETARLVELDDPRATDGVTLLEWDATDEAVDGNFGVLSVDDSGQHFLLVSHPNGGPAAIYRWSVGDESPTKLADGVEYADW